MLRTKLITALAATGALLCFSVSGFAQAPMRLTDSQLDTVTAGLALGVSTGALATGATFALTNSGGGATGSNTALRGGGFVESGVAGGTASAFAPGGTYGTAVATGGATNGASFANISTGGTVVGAGGSVSVGFTAVSGGTTFIP